MGTSVTSVKYRSTNVPAVADGESAPAKKAACHFVITARSAESTGENTTAIANP